MFCSVTPALASLAKRACYIGLQPGYLGLQSGWQTVTGLDQLGDARLVELVAPVRLLQLRLAAAAAIAHVADQPQRLRRLEYGHLLKVERVEERAARTRRVHEQVVPRAHLGVRQVR